jgi:hypothetical protein
MLGLGNYYFKKNDILKYSVPNNYLYLFLELKIWHLY